MGKGQVIEKLVEYNEWFAGARRKVCTAGLNLAGTQAGLITEKAAAIQRGHIQGALEGKNVEARKQAMETWLAESRDYQDCLEFVAAAETDLAAATRDLDIAKMGIRVCECLAKLLEE